MTSKRFKLVEKDIPFLKKDMKIKIVLTVVFALVLAWQTIAFIMDFVNKTNSILNMCISITVIVYALALLCFTIFFTVRNLNLISVIKEKDHCLWDVPFISNTSKTGLINMYKILCLVLGCICGFILIACFIAICVQKSFITLRYLPLLLTVGASCFNAYFFFVSNNYMQKLNKEQNIY